MHNRPRMLTPDLIAVANLVIVVLQSTKSELDQCVVIRLHFNRSSLSWTAFGVVIAKATIRGVVFLLKHPQNNFFRTDFNHLQGHRGCKSNCII